MAKLSFFGMEGGEKSYLLTQTRSLKIGRDPGNDIVLRDAKVSRHHAEIVFEKGFFVLYDLSSANGSYVNGRKIRVAPLTHGADLKLGNSIGRFIDEPAEVADSPGGTVVADLGLRPGADEPTPRIAPPPPPPPPPAAPAPATVNEDGETQPHEKFKPGAAPPPDSNSELAETSLSTKLRLRSTEPIPPIPSAWREKDPEPPVPTTNDPKYKLSRYFIDFGVPYGERSTIRDEADKPLFYFRRIFNVIGFIAGMVAAMIVIAGAAATFFLSVEKHYVLACLAAALTLVFGGIVLILVPRRHAHLFDDEAMTSLALVMWQETRFSFPVLRFSARLADGSVIASFEKNWLTNLARRKWWILDRHGMARFGFAKEDSLARSFFRKFLGTFFGSLRTNYALHFGGKLVGILNRRATVLERYLLDLTEDRTHLLDRRVALALALLIDTVER